MNPYLFLRGISRNGSLWYPARRTARPGFRVSKAVIRVVGNARISMNTPFDLCRRGRLFGVEDAAPPLFAQRILR